MKHNHFESEMSPDYPYGLGKVRIVSDEDGCLTFLVESVQQQIARQVDIRTLFFRFPNGDGSGTISKWGDEGHTNLMSEELSIVYRQARYSPESAQVNLLAFGQSRVVGRCADARCEVPHPVNVIIGKNDLTEPHHIEPAIRGVLHTIVQVEPIHVNAGFRRMSSPLCKAGAISREMAPLPNQRTG